MVRVADDQLARMPLRRPQVPDPPRIIERLARDAGPLLWESHLPQADAAPLDVDRGHQQSMTGAQSPNIRVNYEPGSGRRSALRPIDALPPVVDRSLDGLLWISHIPIAHASG